MGVPKGNAIGKGNPPPAPLGNTYAKGHDGSNAGRPVKPVDLEQLAELARIQCTDEEIASILKISVDTLTNKYSDVLKENRDTGKSSLRREQWKLVLQGNASAAIFLGKVYLRQRDSDPVINVVQELPAVKLKVIEPTSA